MSTPPAPADRREGSPLHAGVWVVWAISGIVALQLAPSPTSALVVVVVAIAVVASQPRAGALRGALPLLVGLLTGFLALRIAVTVLTTHPIPGTPLFTLPEATVPRMLGGFTIGGSVDLDVLLRSGAEAIGILAVLTVIIAFNTVVAHHELLRALPRAFHELGLVVTVAIAFLPGLITSAAEVRAADRARTGGRGTRRHRWRRTLVPVLEGAIERALLLAESMDARGFARSEAARAGLAARIAALAGLVALVAGFGALVSAERGAATVLALAGAGLLTGATLAANRTSGRTRHRPRRWTRDDLVMVAVLMLAPLGVGLAAQLGLATTWDPTSRSVPPFDPATAVALLLLAAPAWLGSSTTSRSRPPAHTERLAV